MSNLTNTGFLFCNSLTKYERFLTREVFVGDIPLGGKNPIRVQSMTTTDTMDTAGTVAQCVRMIEAGCEYIRITAPSIKEAENLKNIKEALRQRGYKTPLIADIHFTPNAAELAARIVEKVRVNPGNYADKKRFEHIEYSEQSYQEELDRIRGKFIPLIKICKEYGTAMRIGTNHGSLSDRILSKFGDTPLGMVESALEFVRICEQENYHSLVLSMKASNTQVMIQAYRLLVQKMKQENMNYPLHLGVTEAGDGEDGRIKSAVGIGTLLEDGLGDTIRVSLTEEPEAEIPVAKALVLRYLYRNQHNPISFNNPSPVNFFEYQKRKTREVLNIGSHHAPVVMADFSHKTKITPASLFALGYQYSVPLDKWNIQDMACDYVFIGNLSVEFEIPGTLGLVLHYNSWLTQKNKPRTYPFLNKQEYLSGQEKSTICNFVYILYQDLSPEFIQIIQNDPSVVLLIDTYNAHGMAEQRALISELMLQHCDVPVILGRAYANLSSDDLMLQSSTDLGALLADGLGDGVFIAAKNCGSDQFVNQTAFGILQATRTRISKTEYISCPSCGRTLFDLQETTAKIRAVTDHLKGIKIGIMGCIVNGPGEMADADYGYVGTGPGKITLYKQKEVVKKNVSEQEAVQQLIQLIKDHGDWTDRKEHA